jgi:hypothetical protein
MKYVFLPVALLLAGCAEPGDRPGPEPEPEFDRPRPGVADYQRLAGEILDGVGALADRFPFLDGVSVPANAKADGVDFTLVHKREPDLVLDVRVTLDTAPSTGVPIEIGRLRVVLQAEGTAAGGVLEEIRRQLDNQILWFNQRFNTEHP